MLKGSQQYSVPALAARPRPRSNRTNSAVAHRCDVATPDCAGPVAVALNGSHIYMDAQTRGNLTARDAWRSAAGGLRGAHRPLLWNYGLSVRHLPQSKTMSATIVAMIAAAENAMTTSNAASTQAASWSV